MKAACKRNGGSSSLRLLRGQKQISLYPSFRTLVTAPSHLELLRTKYPTDDWTNVSQSIASCLSRRLHLQESHPLALTRKLITSRFPTSTYTHYNNLSPIVSVGQNFDSLGFPADHPGRSKSDTYYINADTCLRTHTSAHQADTFRLNASPGYTITADVYRRDAIDRSHYPAFHQMEGARIWDRRDLSTSQLAEMVWKDTNKLQKHDISVEDPDPTVKDSNPLQALHHIEEVEAMANHLKRSLEDVVVTIFKAAQGTSESSLEPLLVRWVEAYFPFTSPSWELEVYWQGEWLEILGCGIVQQDILDHAGVPSKVGWAFGLGLERIAMLLYGIPDIRLFWSHDERFLSQFEEGSPMKRFVSFSKFPPCYKDVSFWLPTDISMDTASANTSGGADITERNSQSSFHENDVMELVREVAGDLAEDVKLVDEFQHPKTKRRSMCYRINYRSLERTLTNDEVNELHSSVVSKLCEDLGVVLR